MAFATILRVHGALKQLRRTRRIDAAALFACVRRRRSLAVAARTTVLLWAVLCLHNPPADLEAAVRVFAYGPVKRCCAARQHLGPIGTEPGGAAHSML